MRYYIRIEWSGDMKYTAYAYDAAMVVQAVFGGASTWHDAHAMALEWIKKRGVKRWIDGIPDDPPSQKCVICSGTGSLS